jgi:phosphoribosylformylglycinamidine synthase
VPIRDLDDDTLTKMSREDHLFLSLEEMRTIRSHYRALGREPTDIELETLAQTWSEHCVHKTLKSTVRYTCSGDDTIDWSGRPGVELQPDGSVIIHNLLKSTVAAATHELIADGVDWTRSVFVDNAGIIDFDEHNAVCVKVETHNHPSAIEPYGGAATGIGGCIRDIMGTGLAAKPIANTDVFCVALPDTKEEDVPDGCIHPKRTLERVVEGVRDYGNRMGIPTLNGTVYFDPRYIANPLVYCGCVGILPNDKTHGDAQPGDLIVAMGGRTGRDGIHGATFSSAELTDTHADEFSHAVQIGNAIEEKRTLDAILRARDFENGCLYTAITDCGAGGFSSAVGEMGEQVGAAVDLDKAPLKYDGLRYDEIWISESQERMVLAVAEENLDALQQICDEEHVELAVLGTFGNTDSDKNPELLLRFDGSEVGRLPMALLHDGIPMPTREAEWTTPSVEIKEAGESDIKRALLDLLAHPNIASKRWIVRQYDHEVQGNTIIKPLVGPGGIGPGDAAVIQPVPGSDQGLAIGCGLQTALGDPANGGDPYLMALAAVDECVRNLVCVGADPERIAILDNFCWPSCDDPMNMASLVRACMGCYDAAKAYRTPFVSGKDSLNNQFRTKDGRLIEIPPTLLITGVGIVPDVNKCVTMDAKGAGNSISFVRGERGPQVARHVASLIQSGEVVSAHDASEGGVLVALAEMLIASEHESLGFGFDAEMSADACFAESSATYLVEHESALDLVPLGVVTTDGSLTIGSTRSIPISELREAFLGTLDW